MCVSLLGILQLKRKWTWRSGIDTIIKGFGTLLSSESILYRMPGTNFQGQLSHKAPQEIPLCVWRASNV